MARQKRPQGDAHQLSLFESETSVPPVLPVEPVPEQHQEAGTPSPDDDDQSEWMDKERLKAWLSTWAREHQFPLFTFTLFDGKKGYIGVVGPGGEHWTDFKASADLDTLIRARMAAQVYKEDHPFDLTTYSRENLKHQGPHDQARRAWLRAWAELRRYTAFWFTMHGKYDGYTQHGVPAGEEEWAGFLERAGRFDIYCCFVAAFTPDVKLEHYLTDAAQRGERKPDNDGLIWRPSNHHTPR